MEKVFHDNENGTLNVSVTYLPDDYNPVITKVVNHLLEDVTVRGFRKGKAPREVAIRYLKDEDIYNGMVNKLIDQDFPHLLEGLERAKDVANIQPSLNIKYDEKKKAYNFLYEFVFLPKATVEKDSGYNIKEDVKEITAEDVDKKIKELATDQAELVPSKEAAENGDHVVIDFTGYMDGKEFDGGSAKDHELVLGSHSFVPGFEEGVVGMKEGEKKTIDITFPKDYLASLAGKPAKFSVVCKAVKKVQLPEINDEFAKELPNYKASTLEELKTKIHDELDKNQKASSRSKKIEEAYAAIEKDAKIVIADRYLDVASQQVQENQLNQVKQYGLDLDSYLKIVGQTKEQFQENAKTQARLDATRFAIMNAIADKEKITVTDEDLENRFGGKEKFEKLKKAGEEQAMKNPSFSFESYLSSVREDILNGKVNDFVYANN